MTTSISPDARRIWRAARGPVIIGAVIIGAAILITLIRGSGTRGALDPDSVAPSGSRALARLLQSHGVEIHRVDSFTAALGWAGRNATLLVTQPDWVDPDLLATLSRNSGHTVLIGARGDAFGALGLQVGIREMVEPEAREPDCSLDVARAAGVATIGGVAYQASSSCYEGTLVQVDRVTLLGDPTPLTNDALDDEGNAALAMRLAGQHQHLVWYQPTLSDEALPKSQQSFYDLIPSSWWFGLVQVAIAVLLLMAWRARRLGPVVSEPLPVVVRAAETTEGRARLYRRARATDHAADALRRAAVNQLIPMLGLTADAQPAAVIERVAARVGRTGAEVHMALYDPAPTTEPDLVMLANALDTLVTEVRTRH